MENKLLSEVEFWDNFWKDLKLPSKINPDFPNDIAIATFLKENLPDGEGKKTLLEVGCTPGKWMVYLNDELHYKVSGVDYSKTGVDTTKNNLELCGVDGTVICSDFTKDTSDTKYDAIVSFGFLEHFVESPWILNKMKSMLNPGGIIIVGIPRLTGLNYHICKFVDATIDYPLLPRHDLTIMSVEVMQHLGNVIEAEVISVEYVGGFEPALFDTANCPLWFRVLFFGAGKIILRIPCDYFQGYIMAAYRLKE